MGGLQVLLMLLDPGHKFTAGYVVGFCFEGDGVYQFKVVPIDVALFNLFCGLLLFAAGLLLLGHMIVVDKAASREDGFPIGEAFLQTFHI